MLRNVRNCMRKLSSKTHLFTVCNILWMLQKSFSLCTLHDKMQCRECDDLMCANCKRTCEDCEHINCAECIRSCKICDDECCVDCRTTCVRCHNVICYGDLLRCVSCHDQVCGDCGRASYQLCTFCREECCIHCIQTCTSCNKTYCSDVCPSVPYAHECVIEKVEEDNTTPSPRSKKQRTK
jgi:hypothetical protein